MSIPKNLRDLRPSENVDRYSYEGDAGPFVMMPVVLIRHSMGRRFLTFARSFEVICYLLGYAIFLYILQLPGKFPIPRFHDIIPQNIAAVLLLIILYIVFAVFHSLRRWIRSLNGIYLHSFYSGTSILMPIARFCLSIANYSVGGLLRLFGNKTPRKIFTDEIWVSRFIIEPVFCVVVAIVLVILRLDWVALWFLRSSRALYLNSRDHFSMYRQEVIDMRDQLLDAAQLAPLMGVKFQDMSEPEIETDLRSEKRKAEQEITKPVLPPSTPKNKESLSLDDLYDELDPNLRKMGRDD